MGLDTSHDCWHGPYSAFMRWRIWLANQIGIHLPLMEGFCPWFEAAAPTDDNDKVYDFQRKRYDPIKWPSVESEPLVELLHHSDCDGEIGWEIAAKIADRLDTIVQNVVKTRAFQEASTQPERADYDGFVAACERFAAGCRDSYKAKENIDFH